MYQEANMDSEALRVAQKHAPHLAVQIIDKQQRRGGGAGFQNMSGEEILRAAKMWEDSRDYQQAIDRYLQITDAHFPNSPDDLEEIWVNCFNIAMTYAKDRV